MPAKAQPSKTLAGKTALKGSASPATKVMGVRKRAAAPSRVQPTAKKARGVSTSNSAMIGVPKASIRKAPARIDANRPSDESDLEEEQSNGSNGEQESDDELARLDTGTLKKTFMLERPQWAEKIRESNDDNTAKPLIDVEPTTASELDEQIEDENEETQKSLKRALAHKAEIPVWAGASDADDIIEDGDQFGDAEDNNNDIVSLAAAYSVNASWDPDAHYVPPPSGARTLSITSQPPAVKALIKGAIRQATGDALFVDAYPSAETMEDYHRQLLTGVCQGLNHTALEDRVNHDPIFLEGISRLLCNRVSNVCCGTKKTTQAKVESAYDLKVDDPEECRTQVKSILNSGDYIYPRKSKDSNLIMRTKPYHHSAILSSLREYYFLGARRSLASKHASRFTSSIEEGPVAQKLEISIPMVCTIATAIYASLQDWSSGYQKKSEFNTDAYEDVYRGHEMFLENIKNAKPTSYHRLMSDLYKAVSSDQAGVSATAIAKSSMALLDLDNMDK